jgi:hypothetical protein
MKIEGDMSIQNSASNKDFPPQNLAISQDLQGICRHEIYH